MIDQDCYSSLLSQSQFQINILTYIGNETLKPDSSCSDSVTCFSWNALIKIKRSLLSKQKSFSATIGKILWHSLIANALKIHLCNVQIRALELLTGYFTDTNLGVGIFLDVPQGYVFLAPWFVCVSQHLAQRQYCMVAMTRFRNRFWGTVMPF